MGQHLLYSYWISCPRFIGGDFNTILTASNKIRGLPIAAAEIENFKDCIESCDITQIHHKDISFTWWNGRAGDDYIFEKLYMLFSNVEFQKIFIFKGGTHIQIWI